jgi:transposase
MAILPIMELSRNRYSCSSACPNAAKLSQKPGDFSALAGVAPRSRAPGAPVFEWPERDSAAAGKLIRVRGIGPTFASVLTHEVFYRSFDNRRQVGSYLGLVSIPWQSGGVRRDQGITRSGNARARRCAIELAWLWLRHQPGSALPGWYRTRVGTMTGRMRRIALVALARKLIVALWRYLQTGTVPEGAVLKA